MRRILSGVAACATIAALALGSAPSAAAATPVPIETLKALAGKWTCVLVRPAIKPVASTEVLTMAGPWLRFDFTYPPSTAHDAAYVTYDSARKHWVYMEIDADGDYGVASSTSPTYNNAVFHTVYPSGEGDETVVIHIRGNNYIQNVFTFKTGGGADVTVTNTCTR